MNPRLSPFKWKFTDNSGDVGEKAKMAIRMEEQRQAKAALETQRVDSEKGKPQRIAQSSRG